jgi:hypothetical protein
LLPDTTNERTRSNDLHIRASRPVVLEVIGRQVPTVALKSRDEMRQVLPINQADVGKKLLWSFNSSATYLNISSIS